MVAVALSGLHEPNKQALGIYGTPQTITCGAPTPGWSSNRFKVTPGG